MQLNRDMFDKKAKSPLLRTYKQDLLSLIKVSLRHGSLSINPTIGDDILKTRPHA